MHFDIMLTWMHYIRRTQQTIANKKNPFTNLILYIKQTQKHDIRRFLNLWFSYIPTGCAALEKHHRPLLFNINGSNQK